MESFMEMTRTAGPATFVLCCICTCIALPHMNGQYFKNKLKDDDKYKKYRENPKFLSEGKKEYDKTKLDSCEANDDGKYDIFTGRGPFVMKKTIDPGDKEKIKCERGWLESMRDGFAPYDCYCALKSAGT